MSNEELMKQRYKVIADYFYNPYKTGDIITVMYGDRSVHITTTHYRDEFGEMVNKHNYFHPNRLDDFPHLFKKLEWWEERKIEDMPEYVNVIPKESLGLQSSVWKVFKWTNVGNRINVDYEKECETPLFAELNGYLPGYLNFALCPPDQKYGRMNVVNLLPATLAEYEQYINQKEKQ